MTTDQEQTAAHSGHEQMVITALNDFDLNSDSMEEKKKMPRGRPPRTHTKCPRVWSGRNCFANGS